MKPTNMVSRGSMFSPAHLFKELVVLAQDDDALLAGLEQKLDVIRDRTMSVATGFTYGFFLAGPGGIGKSHAVLNTLARSGRPYRVSNSRVTSKGLLALFQDLPDHIHVLEDCESIYADKHIAGVLRSALWATVPDGQKAERVATWNTASENAEAVLTGGVVMISNTPLPETDDWQALKTRVHYHEFQPTPQELGAKMRQLAGRGHRHGNYYLGPEACQEVAAAIVELAKRRRRPLDLRLYLKAVADRMQYEAGLCKTHWRDLLESSMSERVVVSKSVPRVEKQAQYLAVLKDIAGLSRKERVAAWKAATGRSQTTMYDLEKAYRQAGLIPVSGSGGNLTGPERPSRDAGGTGIRNGPC